MKKDELQILLSLIPDDIRDETTYVFDESDTVPLPVWVRICKGVTATHCGYGDTLDLKIKGKRRNSIFRRKNGQYNYDGIWRSIRKADAFLKKLKDDEAAKIKAAKVIHGRLKKLYACVRRNKSASLTSDKEITEFGRDPELEITWQEGDNHWHSWGQNYSAVITDGEIALSGSTPWRGMTLEEKKTVLRLFARAADRIAKKREKTKKD